MRNANRGAHESRLAAEDLARLRMGTPENRMVIVAALRFAEPIAREKLVGLLETRLLAHPRFRQRVADPHVWGPPRWIDEPDLDVRAHCTWRTVQDGEPTVEEIVSEGMSAPLDPHRPLWRLDVLEGPSGETALVFFVHHVLADGAALVSILGGLADGAPRLETQQRLDSSTPAAGRIRRVLGGVVGAARLLLRSPDPEALHAPLGTKKDVAFTSALPLDLLKARAHELDVTLSEMLLAAVGDALHGWLASDREAIPRTVHALVPVSLHVGESADAGNQYASVFAPLPMTPLDPVARLRRTARGFRRARSRGSVSAGAELVSAASALAAPLERWGVSRFSRKASVVVSSVRGPSESVRICGSLLRDVIVWAPAPGTIGIAVTMMSYAGRVRIAVSTDARAIGDPTAIASRLEHALGVLLGRA